ncbi:MAG: hypothetical protein NVS4B3_26740 [Gemmatimonadaceae bacterium]
MPHLEQAGPLQRATPVALMVGAAGSLLFVIHAGQRAPAVLRLLFPVWVLSPFAALLVADRFAGRWGRRGRRAVDLSIFGIAVGSLLLYANDALGHRRPQAAFAYVAVPAASLLAVAITVSLATLTSRRRRNDKGS